MDTVLVKFAGIASEFEVSKILDLGFTEVRWYGAIIAFGFLLAVLLQLFRVSAHFHKSARERYRSVREGLFRPYHPTLTLHSFSPITVPSFSKRNLRVPSVLSEKVISILCTFLGWWIFKVLTNTSLM